MPKNGFIDFKEIKKKYTMIQVLTHYGLLDDMEFKDESVRGRCPVCEGNDPKAFSVNIPKNIWHCFLCGSGGNILDFVMKMENVNVRKAGLLLTEWFASKKDSKTVERETNPAMVVCEKADGLEVETTVNKPLDFALSTLVVNEHVEELGLSEETIEKFGIGYCTRGLMKNRIAIPIHNPKGELVAYCGHSTDGKPDKYPPKFDPSLEVFNVHRLELNSSPETLLIVWDYIDCMWAWNYGFRNVICIPSLPVSQAQLSILERIVSAYAKVVLVSVDDSASITLARAISDITPVKIIVPHSGFTSIRHNYGKNIDQLLAI